MSQLHPWESLLCGVSHPQQYIGCEWNSMPSSPGRPDVTLVYPDTYELGMSNFGLSVVRHLLVSAGRFNVRRAYCPSPDMCARLEGTGTQWVCIEDGYPVSGSAAIGFGIASESLFTNVLYLLRMAGLPLRRSDRGNGHPVVVAGGGGIANPLPLSPFVDVFYLGDAEEGVVDLFETLTGPGSRDSRIDAVSDMPGVWVPGNGRRTVRFRKAPSLLREWAPVRQLVPLAAITHDRAVVEIARGCTRGCRFCQATQISRPVRERAPSEVLSLVEEVVAQTGWEDAGLLSLSFSDYSCLPELLQGVSALEKRMGINVSRPSLRPDSFARLSAGSRLAGRVTLAPEAGSERLRKKLNKPIDDEGILSAVDSAFALGARGVKLYFMVGLPGEEEEDLAALVSLAERACSVASARGRPRKGAISVALSPFVPKPHTPLQWAPQMPGDEVWRRIGLVRSSLRNVRPGWNDPRLSLVEAVLGLGDDSDAADLLAEAAEAGARFDAWADRLRWDVWESVLGRRPSLVERVEKGLDISEDPPWSFVSPGASPDFLRSEYLKFLEGIPTPDCRESGCNACGACPAGGHVIAGSAGASLPEALIKSPAGASGMLRVWWGRTGLARFSSHLDMARLWARAIRRSGLPVATRGAHVRRVRLRFGPALPLGFESGAEVLDILLTGRPAGDARSAIAAALPPGFEVLGTALLEPGRAAPDAEAVSAEYEVDCADVFRAMELLSGTDGIESVRGMDGERVAVTARLGSASARIDRLLSQAGIPVRLIRRTGLIGSGGRRLSPPCPGDEGEDYR